MRRGWVIAGVCLLALGVSPSFASAGLAWQSDDGDHHITLDLETRFRVEVWDARATDADSFTALRSRARLGYAWRDRVRARVEFQDARINGLGSDSSGAAELYRAAAGEDSQTHGVRIRQLWLEYKPSSKLSLRAGRQDIKLGTEVMYPEANWNYLKLARVSQRLVGTVGWTHGERSNDGVSAAYDFGEHYLYLFGAKPTTGVFDLDSSYASQSDILYGGATFTAKRGAWLPNSEVRLFAIAYQDDRDTDDGGLVSDDELDIYTLGASLIGVYPCGPGNADLVLWGAYQWGSWPIVGDDLDHRAWAAVVEAGYQWTRARMQPWLRVGVNLASGDGSATDGDHESFFNLLPTNHLYYGYQDQFALGNLLNYFVQLKAKPLPKTDVNLMLHQFSKWTTDDGRHFGTGAYNKDGFGFTVDDSSSARNMGTALDLVVGYQLNERVSLLAGYTYMWGHGHWNDVPSGDDDTRWAFFQLSAKY